MRDYFTKFKYISVKLIQQEVINWWAWRLTYLCRPFHPLARFRNQNELFWFHGRYLPPAVEMCIGDEYICFVAIFEGIELTSFWFQLKFNLVFKIQGLTTFYCTYLVYTAYFAIKMIILFTVWIWNEIIWRYQDQNIHWYLIFIIPYLSVWNYAVMT